MFTIDLLKGEAVPVRMGPKGIAIIAAAFAVPVIVAIVIVSGYLRTQVIIAVNEQTAVNYQGKIDRLSDAVQIQKLFERTKETLNTCLLEVSSAIGDHIQWSPVLVDIVKNMPDQMIMTSLAVDKKSVKIKIPQKDAPGGTIDVSVPVPVLQISLSGSPNFDCDRAIRDFRDRLRSSLVLGPKLEDIRFSQKSGALDGQTVVSYEIDCVFRPKI